MKFIFSMSHEHLESLSLLMGSDLINYVTFCPHYKFHFKNIIREN